MAAINIQTINADTAAVLAEAFENLRQRISANIESTGRRASGATQESLTVEVVTDTEGFSATLSARPFFGALETGTQPWRTQYRHPPKFFRDIIAEWIEAKGLDLSPYLVARKIMREGSAIYREGGRPDVYSDEIPATIESLRANIVRAFVTPITTTHIQLNKELNTVEL